MGNIRICRITGEQENEAKALLPTELSEVLLEGTPITAFAASLPEGAAGALAGFAEGSSFRIEWLYVSPEYRGRGLGSALMDALGELLADEDLIISAEYTQTDADMETLRPFLLKQGFTQEEAGYPRYSLGTVKDLKIKAGIPKGALQYEILPFSEVPKDILVRAGIEAEKQDRPHPQGGLLSQNVLKDYSFSVLQNDQVRAYATVEQKAEDLLLISSLWSELSDPRILMLMLFQESVLIKKAYPGDTKVAFLALNETSEKLAKKVFGFLQSATYVFSKDA